MNKKQMLVAGSLLAVLALSSQAAIVTTEMEEIVADCTAWITYGITAFMTLVGAGLTIVGASWVYRKVKSALSKA